MKPSLASTHQSFASVEQSIASLKPSLASIRQSIASRKPSIGSKNQTNSRMSTPGSVFWQTTAVLSHSIAPGRSRPVVLSDRQGFDRRWFAPNLQAVYVPTRVDQVAGCLAAAITAYGRDVKVTSGRHCYE